MGDRTPEVNLSGKLTSKYLTPCRTFGLKRRSTPKSDILKKVRSENDSSLVNGKLTDSPISITSLSPSNLCKNGFENPTTPIKLSEAKSPTVTTEQIELNCTPCSSSRKLALKTKKQEKIDSLNARSTQLLNGDHCQKTPKLSKVKLKNEQVNSSSITPVKSQHSVDETNPSESEILTQIRRINDKYNRLEKLKQEQIYSRIHNLIELQKSTDKWLSAFKEIAITLHSELQERGRSCSILDVLVDHNISLERVGFNSESLEFD